MTACIEKKLFLNQWQFSEAGKNEWLTANVPGTVHTDLWQHNKIEAPFAGTNEHRQQWIDKSSWQYRTSFDLEPERLQQTHVELVFEGLDTYADIFINGRHMLSTDNMFRTWKLDITAIVKEKGNEVVVHFHSPVAIDLPKIEQRGYNLPATNDQSELGGLGDNKISVYARKAPYHYGWDWGPRFVTSGIWRPVYIQSRSGATITELYMEQRDITQAQAQIKAIVEVESDKELQGTLLIENGEGGVWEASAAIRSGRNTLELEFSMDEPKLWWSRGLGEPHLYTFTASLLVHDQCQSKASVRTGLRSAKLITKQDKHGSSFYIELNGIPVFCKGANHIPNDSFLPDITYERYRHEIASAAAANMNMLRVWGGGIYEASDFYALCDEYGIMVWQDFMFACSMYPGDKHFLDNVRAEAEENIRRLRNYACIVLWCGNNEIDLAWSAYNETGGWKWKQQYDQEQQRQLWQDYETIFHGILPEAVNRLSATTAYWPSSPLAKLSGDASQHSFSQSPDGDVHYWGVWHSVAPFDEYNTHIGRFMSEYGFQSFPELATVLSYATEDELRIDSEVMLAHQKNNRGNFLIKQYMELYMRQPNDFHGFLYLSQVLQAEAVKTAIEAHRRNKPYCMGSLYWQMNDCWPVASWSGMDYYGRWKALHYYAKRSFEDVLLSVDGSEQGKLHLHLINDSLFSLSGTVVIELLSFDGQCVSRKHIPTEAAAGKHNIIWSADLEQLLKAQDAATLVLAAKYESQATVLASTEHYFVNWKSMHPGARSSELQVVEVAGSNGTQVELRSATLALKVRLSSETEGIFSSNYFDLLPNIPKIVTFYERSDGPLPFVPASPSQLAVHTMADFTAQDV